MSLTSFLEFEDCGANVGDGYCDDDLNVLECYFDGNDCCLGTETNTAFCEDCHCYSGKCFC